MESSVKIDLDLSGLNEVYSACQELSKKVHVGVLNNPQAAMKAFQTEYGWITSQGKIVPPRSTTQLPLDVKNEEIQDKALSKLTSFTLDVSRETIEELGRQSVYAIEDAFATKGYGMWKDNAPWTIAVKGRNEPEVDTGELGDSYSYEVQE